MDQHSESETDEEDDVDDDVTSPQTVYAVIKSSRYMAPKCKRSIPISNFMTSVLFNLPEKQFKQHARMSKHAFSVILELIQGDTVFQNNANNYQAPIMHQLIVALYRFGMYGNAASAGQVATRFGIGAGTVDLYTNCVIVALLRLREHVVTWPTEEEKAILKDDNRNISGFPNCIGHVDGTGIVLAASPAENGEEYFTRKSQYAIAAMLVVDTNLRIRYADCGFVGSVHDSRVWRNSDLARHPEKYFQNDEYLLGDKGYPLLKEIITPYKEPKASVQNNKRFNFHLSQA